MRERGRRRVGRERGVRERTEKSWEGERSERERTEKSWEGERSERERTEKSWEGERREGQVGRERGGEDGGERREGGRSLHLMYSLGRFVLQQSLHSAINGRRHSNTTLVPSAPCELCGCSIQIGRVSSNVCNEYLRGNGLTLL